MFYPLSLFIGLRYTKSKRNNKFISFVSLFSTGGITLGVLALITVLSVMNGFEAELKTRILGAIPQAVLTNNNQTLNDWENKIPPLLQIESVKSVEPIINSEAIIQSTEQLQGITFEGIYPEYYASEVVSESIYAGKLENLTSRSYHIIIGRSLARTLNVQMGDKVRIISARGTRFTPLGQLPSQRNFTIAGFFDVGSDVDKYLVLMHAQDLARLIRIEENQITGLRFAFDDPFDVLTWTPPDLATDETISDWRSTHGELFTDRKNGKKYDLVIVVFNHSGSSL
ncbi:ABC transporter permease [Psychromonas sp. KJ10-10]|uniref:ABC transporter permease n=1 Tax=Psychromonas sp. KJ10-10 TaxID=3391823 RepID=UPI0039B628A6